MIKKNRWLIVIGTFVIQLNIGTILIYSAFKPFLKDYFQNWSSLDLALPSQIILISYAIGFIIAGRLQDKYNPRIIVTIGGVLFGSGLIISSFAQDISIFILGYSILGGFGMGTCYVSPW